MRLRALTWNIHKGIGGVDRKYRPERIVAVLQHYDPDIVFLQEVDDGVPRSRFHRQVDHLAEALGYRHRAFGPNVKLRRGRYGNAILARWPLSDVTNIDLTIAPKKRRGALYARCRVRRGRKTRTLALFNMHLGLAQYERKKQVRRLLRAPPLGQFHARTPVLAGGDLNDVWGNLGRHSLVPAGFRRAGRPAATFPAYMPARPLDALWVRGDLDVRRCFRSRMAVTRDASDHLPLVCELQLTWA